MDINNHSSNPAQTGFTSNGKKLAPVQENTASEGRPAASPGLGGTASTTVEVTDTAKRMLELENKLADMPEVDLEKVERVKAALQEGSLAIDTKRIAQGLLGVEQELNQDIF